MGNIDIVKLAKRIIELQKDRNELMAIIKKIVEALPKNKQDKINIFIEGLECR